MGRWRTQMSAEEVEQAARRAEAWLDSNDGQKAIGEALNNAEKTNEQVYAARLVDPAKLRIPLNL